MINDSETRQRDTTHALGLDTSPAPIIMITVLTPPHHPNVLITLSHARKKDVAITQQDSPVTCDALPALHAVQRQSQVPISCEDAECHGARFKRGQTRRKNHIIHRVSGDESENDTNAYGT